MSSPRTVSVVIPAYNAAPYLADAIQALLAQTLAPREIIVVDDGSTDGTAAVGSRFLPPVRVITQRNAGASAARNRGIAEATSDLIAMQDADDLSHPDRLARQLAVFERRDDVVSCFTGYWRFDHSGRLEDVAAPAPGGDLDSLDFLAECQYLVGSVMFDRRRAAGLLYPAGVRSGEDIIFSALLATRGRVDAVTTPLYGYRSHPAQSSIAFRATATTNQFFEDRLHWAREHWQQFWPEQGWDVVEARLWAGLATQTEGNYWARNRRYFLIDREYLRQRRPSHVPRPRVVDWKWYPAWAWQARQVLAGLAARVRSPR